MGELERELERRVGKGKSGEKAMRTGMLWHPCMHDVLSSHIPTSGILF